MPEFRLCAGLVLGAMAVIPIGCETIYHATTKSDRPKPEAKAVAVGSLAPVVPPSCGQDGTCLSVLSYNLKHRDVPLQLAAVSNAFKATFNQKPDFVLLQEVVFDRPERRGKDNTAAELAEQIGYECRGEARDGGVEGVAILSRHPFEYFDHLHLKARDALLSGGFPRVSVMGEFVLPGMGRVRVVNVHLTQRPSVHDIRREQLQETLHWMATRQTVMPADVIILGGDFNIEPGWDELALIADTSATSGLQFLDYNTKQASSGDIGNPYQRVDYLFIASPTKSVDDVGEAILWSDGVPTIDGSGTVHPSDHLPLLHVFNIGPGTGTGAGTTPHS